MRSLLIIGTLLIVISFPSGKAEAQSAEGQRRIDEKKLKNLETTELKTPEGKDRFAIDYGGWLDFRYDDFNDDDNDSSTEDSLNYTYSADFRFWLKATLKPPPGASYKNEHSIYLRMKDLNIDRRPEEINGGYEHDGPHLDYGYLTLDFRPYWFEIGRRYFSMGQGITYGNLQDGIELRGELEFWTLRALFSHTLPDEDNIDTSVPGWDDDNSNRFFYGLEATYLGVSNQGVYGYFLVQRDDSSEGPDDPLHDFTYDSEHFALGAQGKIISTMHYWAEVMGETGKSRIFDTGEKKNIYAWGIDLGITYDLDVYSHPNFTVEYAYGSGDADRTSVTDTQNGNLTGDDRNFLYFGYLPTGFVFSPRLSNIRMFKGSILLKPLEKYDSFENFTFGIDYFRFYKDKAAGGVSDAEASLSKKDLGGEIDVSITWQILSDLTCTLEYGHFEPGNAFPDSQNDNEDYFAVNLNITF